MLVVVLFAGLAGEYCVLVAVFVVFVTWLKIEDPNFLLQKDGVLVEGYI